MEVVADSPGIQVAGLRERDVIIRFAGQAVTGVDDLHRLLTNERNGMPCEVEVIRDTQLLKVIITPRSRA